MNVIDEVVFVGLRLESALASTMTSAVVEVIRILLHRLMLSEIRCGLLLTTLHFNHRLASGRQG